MKENVVDNYRAEIMTSIYTRYKSILDDRGVNCTRYSVQALTEKILNHLGACIVVTRGSNKQGNVLHNIDMNSEHALEVTKEYASSYEHSVTKVALHLRAAILSSYNIRNSQAL